MLGTSIRTSTSSAREGNGPSWGANGYRIAGTRLRQAGSTPSLNTLSNCGLLIGVNSGGLYPIVKCVLDGGAHTLPPAGDLRHRLAHVIPEVPTGHHFNFRNSQITHIIAPFRFTNCCRSKLARFPPRPWNLG
jgi:hypothetical protein